MTSASAAACMTANIRNAHERTMSLMTIHHLLCLCLACCSCGFRESFRESVRRYCEVLVCINRSTSLITKLLPAMTPRASIR